LGAYSIAIALVVQALTGLVLNWLFVRWRPSLIFDRHIAAQLLGYSKHVLGGSVIVYLATNMDNTFVSRSSGVAALGLYVMAYNIANMPATQVADVIGRVLFPSFVELNDDPERLRRAYVRSLKILIVIAFPLLAGLAAVAAPFVTVVMGAKWLPIIGVLQILIIFTAFRVVSGATGSLFLATGHTRFILWSGIAGLLLQAAFLTLAVVWLGGGIIGASWAVSLASVINGVFIATWVNKVVPFSWFDLLEPAIRLVTPSVLMGLVVFALSLALPLEWWALGLEVMVGAALYALFVLTILGRSFITDMVRLVRKRPA
jgi:O-antigen/teichoic acid export membrane protein